MSALARTGRSKASSMRARALPTLCADSRGRRDSNASTTRPAKLGRVDAPRQDATGPNTQPLVTYPLASKADSATSSSSRLRGRFRNRTVWYPQRNSRGRRLFAQRQEDRLGGILGPSLWFTAHQRPTRFLSPPRCGKRIGLSYGKLRSPFKNATCRLCIARHHEKHRRDSLSFTIADVSVFHMITGRLSLAYPDSVPGRTQRYAF